MEDTQYFLFASNDITILDRSYTEKKKKKKRKKHQLADRLQFFSFMVTQTSVSNPLFSRHIGIQELSKADQVLRNPIRILLRVYTSCYCCYK